MQNYTLSTDHLRLSLMPLGATVVSLKYHGRELTLGYPTAEEYLRGTSYLGAVIGRCANRIGGAAVKIDGKAYRLPANEGKNLLHGGTEGFHFQLWNAEPLGKSAIRFTRTSPDGEGGFPGTLRAAVTYTLQENRLRIDFTAETDAPTLYAPTTHLYFRVGDGDVRRACLQLPADRYLPTDAENLPLAPAPAAAPFDFRSLRQIASAYDHCFCLTPGGGETVLQDEAVRVTLRTDFPALHVYTGEFLEQPFSGIALEPEFYPDTPNHPDFPSILLRPGEHFSRFVEYQFA